MKKQTKIALVVLISIFILIYIFIQTGYIERIDNWVYSAVLSIRNPILTQIMIVITNIGGVTAVCLISLILSIIMLFLKKRKYAVAVILNVLFSSVSYVILKSIFQRLRPHVAERLIEESGYSFPSGHSTNNMAFYGFIIYLVYTNVENKALRNFIITILCILIGLIGFSRIYLRVHYPSDVLAGFCLGLVCVIVFISVVLPKIEKK